MEKIEKIPRSLSEVEPVALKIWEILKEHCEFKQCKIAGSIRRRKTLVSDIEIVCVPKMVVTGEKIIQKAGDLFAPASEGIVVPVETRDPKFISAAQNLGEIFSGDIHTGRYVKIKVGLGINSIQLDLFIPQKHDFGRILAIRTGSAQYSNKILAGTWVRNGWVGTKDGLRLKRECEETPSGWRVHLDDLSPKLPPPFHTEESFFEFLGIKWISPSIRDLQ